MSDWSPWARDAAEIISWIVIGAGLIQVLFYIVQLVFAAIALSERPPVASTSILWRRYADLAPQIAVIAPAYNEELTITESVDALLALHYPDFEVVVINDGSGDATLEKLIGHYGLVPVERFYDLAVPHAPIRGLYAAPNHPRLIVVDKVNGGGKADALNAGVNVARAPLVCAIDADTLLEPDALIRVVRPFIDEPARTIAVGGTIRIANGCRVDRGRVAEVRMPRNFLALIQIVEYLRAFLMARLGLSRMGLLLIVSGAFGLFKRQAAIDVGGFSHDTVGEDMELVVKLHRHFRDRGEPYSINFVAEPVAWTEAPETLRILGSQRMRWQRGSLETFVKHRDMFLNPRYGRIGMIAFPQVFVVDVFGPIAELLGYVLIPLFWALGLLSFTYVLAQVSVIFTFGLFLSVVTLILEEVELRRLPKARHLALLTLVSLAENFGYRQINNYWRVKGYYQFLRKRKGWGEMTRKGFQRS
jgi:cellulose synthase/poly-beta-1,6-N-acetylglucosamine synthase-like glycosyltransferase